MEHPLRIENIRKYATQYHKNIYDDVINYVIELLNPVLDRLWKASTIQQLADNNKLLFGQFSSDLLFLEYENYIKNHTEEETFYHLVYFTADYLLNKIISYGSVQSTIHKLDEITIKNIEDGINLYGGDIKNALYYDKEDITKMFESLKIEDLKIVSEPYSSENIRHIFRDIGLTQLENDTVEQVQLILEPIISKLWQYSTFKPFLQSFRSNVHYDEYTKFVEQVRKNREKYGDEKTFYWMISEAINLLIEKIAVSVFNFSSRENRSKIVVDIKRLYLSIFSSKDLVANLNL